ncbi:MAG: hypothetical protein ACRDUY_14735 [Nitriliruptorales bacterium]
MESWQIILGLFFALLPVMLMLDFWGEERVDPRGHPRIRPWPRHESAARVDAESAHDEDVLATH